MRTPSELCSKTISESQQHGDTKCFQNVCVARRVTVSTYCCGIHHYYDSGIRVGCEADLEWKWNMKCDRINVILVILSNSLLLFRSFAASVGGYWKQHENICIEKGKHDDLPIGFLKNGNSRHFFDPRNAKQKLTLRCNCPPPPQHTHTHTHTHELLKSPPPFPHFVSTHIPYPEGAEGSRIRHNAIEALFGTAVGRASILGTFVEDFAAIC